MERKGFDRPCCYTKLRRRVVFAEDHAAWVRRTFRRFVTERPTVWIARELTRLGGSKHHRASTWPAEALACWFAGQGSVAPDGPATRGRSAATPEALAQRDRAKALRDGGLPVQEISGELCCYRDTVTALIAAWFEARCLTAASRTRVCLANLVRPPNRSEATVVKLPRRRARCVGQGGREHFMPPCPGRVPRRRPTPTAADPDPAKLECFEKKVRPIFAEHCAACHSAETKPTGGLRVDDRNGLLADGNAGASVVPAKPAESLVLKRFTQKDTRRMPLEGDALSDRQIADLMAWVKDGAAWPAPPGLGAVKPRYEELKASHWACTPTPLPTRRPSCSCTPAAPTPRSRGRVWGRG